jgi:hypothetical protein
MKASADPESRTGRVFVSGSVPSTLPSEDQDAFVPWWETPYGRWRKAIEVEAMKRFPNFHLKLAGPELSWEGWLRSVLTGARYDATVAYPFGFPDMAPVATINNRIFPAETPHLLWGNRPCLFVPDHGARSGYDPARTTAATIVTWTSLWIHAYETWRATGEWPGQEA